MKRLLLLAIWLIGLQICGAASFLPVPDKPIRFTGVHWNDEWEGDSPVEVEGRFSSLAKFDTGEIVQLKLTPIGKPARPREWPVLTFWVTPQGAIYRIGGEDVSKAPEVDPFEIVVPEFNEEERFTKPPASTAEVTVSTSDRGWRWASLPWTTNINTDDGSLVRYLTTHPSGHFTKFVWQRNLGPTELSMGSGARQDGWSLHRTVEPAGKIAKEDITGLLAALPEEFIPAGDALKSSTPADRAPLVSAANDAVIDSLRARLRVDRAAGWLILSSETDGEGENLEAGLWKRSDGSRVLVMLLQQWTSGPTHTRAVRAVEYRKGTFRHVTTSLPLPSDADFYTEEETAKRPPGGLVEGRWSLPRQGTTISIRPPNEEAADYMPENVTSDETFFFELIWDGAGFGSVQLPRIIPAADWEPKEWAFQSGGTIPAALFLKRSGASLKGELVQPGKSRTAVAEIDPAGEEIAFTIGGESAGTTRLVDNGGTGVLWNGLSFTKGFASDNEDALDAIPRDPEAMALPRYKILGADGVFYPRFQSGSAEWKAINEKIAAIVEKERKFYRNAPKTDADETSFGTRFRITGVGETTFSMIISADFYLGGPHGQSVNKTLNYDFKGKRFLQLTDVLEAKQFAKLVELINKALAEKELISEGQTPVSADMLADVSWTIDPGNELTFHFSPESLFTGAPESTVTLRWEQLNEAGLIREQGVFDPDPQ
jgi:hypothetical protein